MPTKVNLSTDVFSKLFAENPKYALIAYTPRQVPRLQNIAPIIHRLKQYVTKVIRFTHKQLISEIKRENQNLSTQQIADYCEEVMRTLKLNKYMVNELVWYIQDEI